MNPHLRTSLLVLVALTFATGVLYPLAVTAVAQAAFPFQSNGSLIAHGSALVGQPFDDPAWFWSRPSATSPPYDGAASSGSNLGPSNPALLEAVRARIAALRAWNPSDLRPGPVDLVTASGSGLDPDISPEAAAYQVPRVARARRIPEEQLADLVRAHVESRQFGCLGEPRVNVLLLNVALDRLAPH